MMSTPPPADPHFCRSRPRNCVQIEHWIEERHRQLTWVCLCAIVVKGDDFRSSHIPYANAVDFLASGVPLALQKESSSSRHLAAVGILCWK